MNNKERFTDRVEKYVKYRPSYPREAVDFLYETVGFRPDSVVADIGAGTGIFSRLLLARGTSVIAVEPNQAMREEAERASEGDAKFRTVAAAAEETGLPDHSVDFIVCAQSFHWFDRAAAQTEFRRILKQGGRAALIWNSRLTEGTPFLEQYDKLLFKYGTDYAAINHTNITPEMLEMFFRAGTLREERFANSQLFNYDELAGRLLSSSYAPAAGHPNHEPMMTELREIFDSTQQDGRVSFDYVTQLFWGEL